ncbi:MAG: MATE family efflux transporter [Myxococcota bacterium]|nr:MATE family efflux transporter [Myxococcota bacterium]
MSLPSTERVAPTARALVGLAWPIVVSRSAQAIVGLADALMVAHLGATALAAATTGAMNTFALFILPMGLVFIVGSFASQHFGRGDPVGARRFAFYGLLVALLTQGVALFSLPFIPAVISAFEFEPVLSGLIQDYLAIRLMASGAVVMVETLASYYGGIGNTRRPMVISLIAMVLNIFGNWLLIDGHLGFPGMGVQGAAWASALSTVVAGLIFLALFFRDGWREGVIFPRLRRSELWSTLRYGTPSGLNWFFEFAGFLFFVNVVVGGLGTTSLAALMSVMQLNSVAFMPAMALASAGAIVVGQAIGAGHRDDVPKAVKLTFFLAGGWQSLVGVIYLLVPALAFAPFARGEEGPELLQIGIRMLMLSAAWQLFDAAVATLAEALRAAGDTTFTLWARTFLTWAVFAPGSWYMVHRMGFGDTTAMLWLVFYIAGLAAVLWWRFQSGAWRRFDLSGSGAPLH